MLRWGRELTNIRKFAILLHKSLFLISSLFDFETQNKILMKIHTKRDYLQYINPIILNATVLKKQFTNYQTEKKTTFILWTFQLGTINWNSGKNLLSYGNHKHCACYPRKCFLSTSSKSMRFSRSPDYVQRPNHQQGQIEI